MVMLMVREIIFEIFSAAPRQHHFVFDKHQLMGHFQEPPAQEPGVSSTASTAGYCLETGLSCPVCDPAATISVNRNRYRRQGGLQLYSLKNKSKLQGRYHFATRKGKEGYVSMYVVCRVKNMLKSQLKLRRIIEIRLQSFLSVFFRPCNFMPLVIYLQIILL